MSNRKPSPLFSRSILAVALFVGGGVGNPAHAGGIPVFDALAHAEAIIMRSEAVQQTLHLVEQINWLTQQYQQLVNLYESIHGPSDLARLILDDAAIYENLPPEYQAVVDTANRWRDIGGRVQRILKAESLPEGATAAAEYVRKREREMAASQMAALELAYEGAAKRRQEIGLLMAEVSRATNPKARETLQARIALHQGLLAAEEQQLEAMGRLQDAEQRLLEQQRREAYLMAISNDNPQTLTFPSADEVRAYLGGRR